MLFIKKFTTTLIAMIKGVLGFLRKKNLTKKPSLLGIIFFSLSHTQKNIYSHIDYKVIV